MADNTSQNTPDITAEKEHVSEQPNAPNVGSKATSMTLQPAKPRRQAWYRRLGAGIIMDIRARGPWYFSDWTDAWNYRVVPATALIFFAKYVVQPRIVSHCLTRSVYSPELRSLSI